ncbi:MAG: hypothetical protein KDK70_29360 [Myxococcales bacterium]|nr:hypothetical protein [Myxococcales bacterium]
MRWIGWNGWNGWNGWMGGLGALALALTLVPSCGCSLEDALENAPCESDDDCLGSQACIKTVHQAATGGVGWCRSDDKCVAGQQEGCIAADGACTLLPLYVVTDPATQISYCCEANGANIEDLAVVDADGSSARCLACATDLCSDQGDLSEPCSMGEPRCTIIQDTCGCRIPEAQLENSDCDDDATCGEGFVCTRTLEQMAEPDDVQSAVEPGWCRPQDAPECVAGQQEGCRSTQGCSSGEEQCAGQFCYCCASPANSDQFSVHVYMEDGASAACIECDRTPCTGGYTCTEIDDMGMGCDIPQGEICGCRPTM